MRSLVGLRDRRSLAGKPASDIKRTTMEEEKRMTSNCRGRVVEDPNFESKASLLLRPSKSSSSNSRMGGQDHGWRGQEPSESKSE
jgi:hypothetical protein